MKKLFEYFTHRTKNESYTIQTKAKALAGLTLVAFVFVALRTISNIILLDVESNLFNQLGIPLIMAAVTILSLILLRTTGYNCLLYTSDAADD